MIGAQRLRRVHELQDLCARIDEVAQAVRLRRSFLFGRLWWVQTALHELADHCVSLVELRGQGVPILFELIGQLADRRFQRREAFDDDFIRGDARLLLGVADEQRHVLDVEMVDHFSPD